MVSSDVMRLMRYGNANNIEDAINDELWKFMAEEIIKFSDANGSIRIVGSSISNYNDPSRHATDYMLEVEIVKETNAQNHRSNYTTIRLR